MLLLIAVPWWTSKRLLLAILGFFGFINVYALRVNMSVAIVCMVNRTAIASDSDTNQTGSNNTNQAPLASSCGLVGANNSSDESFMVHI